MVLTVEEKSNRIQEYQVHGSDTGSAKVQVALITARLDYLQEHFKGHEKDHHSRQGLLKLVGKRRRLLDYIKKQDVSEYRTLIDKLGIRK
jgi:small subunit ribosomal protein S15